ncbi:polysaccharide biosynthesis tyrosine autokinase [Dermacoccus barathri]|uniref:non-specific protein-tyrosine kinase n=2 Tax=Dermacoccus barathri TaxID=322601 RepID=A0ABN2B5M0_9MICO
MNQGKNRVTLEEVWKAARRYWLTIVGAALVGAILATVFVLVQPKKYTATTTAYVVAGETHAAQGDKQAQAAMAYSNSMLAKQKAQSWLPLFKDSTVAQNVIKKFQLKTSPSALVSGVSTTLDQDAPTITVSAQASNPTAARDIANGIVTATADRVKEIEGDGAGARITLVSNAALPSAPSYPQPGRIIPLGVVAGVLVGLLLALLQARRDTRVRGEEDVEEVASTSVLAAIPQNKGMDTDSREAESEDFRTREALRQLRTNLRFVDPDNPPRSIVVTSSRMGEGKSSIASNLARVLAESGEKVLLVDADLRRPMISTILDIEPDVGLSQAIAGAVDIEDAILPTTHRNMFSLPAGQIPPNPSELLGSRSMKRLIERLTEEYFVILDAPPLLPVTDAALLLPSTDGALLVIDVTVTRKEQIAHAVRNVKQVNGHLLGAVMNRVKIEKGGRYGYSKYGYGAEYAYEAYTADSGAGAKQSSKKSREKSTSTLVVPDAPTRPDPDSQARRSGVAPSASAPVDDSQADWLASPTPRRVRRSLQQQSGPNPTSESDRP